MRHISNYPASAVDQPGQQELFEAATHLEWDPDAIERMEAEIERQVEAEMKEGGTER